MALDDQDEGMSSSQGPFQKPQDRMLEKKLPFSPHFLTPAGMLLPKHQQPPPMYGPRGATVPPKFIPKYTNVSEQPNFKGPARGRGRGRGGGGGRGTRGGRGGQMHSMGGGGAGRKPQQRDEPTLPPRNWSLWCESCDRDFHSADLLEKHKSEHKECGIDGCKFVGHPAVVQNHITQQHESGLFAKLKNIDTPEDIVKWREERKKRYPTMANIDLKQKAREARQERGEKLEEPTAKFGNNTNSHSRGKNPKKGPGVNQKKNKRQKNQGGLEAQKGRGNAAVKSEPEVADGSEEEETSRQGVRMFKGTRGLWAEVKVENEEKDNENLKVDQDDSMEDADTENTANPLLKLLGMYGDSDGSGSEDEGGKEEIAAEQKEEALKAETEPEVSVVAKEISSEEKCGDEKKDHEVERTNGTPEENQIEMQPDNANADNANQEHSQDNGNKRKLGTDKEDTERFPKKQQRKNNHGNVPSEEVKKKVLKSGLNYESLRRTKPNTLLFKLLQGEIRHERNVLLQAVRFVVQKNFFDAESDKKET